MKRLLILALGLLAACATSPESTANSPAQPFTDKTAVPLPTLNPAEITLGEQIYAANCAECHGVNLEGESDWKVQNEDKSFRAPPHTADGHTWHHPDAQLLEAIRLGGVRFEGVNVGGTSNMPAFGETLSEAEITAVLTFIKSNWPDETRAVQWQVSTQSQE